MSFCESYCQYEHLLYQNIYSKIAETFCVCLFGILLLGLVNTNIFLISVVGQRCLYWKMEGEIWELLYQTIFLDSALKGLNQYFSNGLRAESPDRDVKTIFGH